VYQAFKQLHEQATPLILGNVWDVNSAIALEQQGYQAIGTSSAAVAASLGVEDGEQLSFAALFNVAQAIRAKTALPLTVDLEGGYSRDPSRIAKHIVDLCGIGVVGVNLEDSVVTDGHRALLEAEAFSHTIRAVKASLSEAGVEVFLNIRTDGFLLGVDNALVQTQERGTLYEQAGADGLFVPCVTQTTDIEAVVNSTALPVNVMAMPDLPAFSTLQQLGVKRISFGPFLYNAVSRYVNDTLAVVEELRAFSPLF